MTAYATQKDAIDFPENTYPLRPASQVMNLERLGSMYQSRLSFMRTLVRRIMHEQWAITPSLFSLDAQGYGTVTFTINASHSLFTFVLFSNYLADEDRNDRVIATQWDLTMALVEGEVSPDYLETLRKNVPKQEAGRFDPNVLVLSRANRSGRNFDYVINRLKQGKQPEITQLTKVGYLYRTTAVYGSGKMGMADWEKIQNKHPDLARPFAAEMLTCLMLRHFSLMQVEHIAQQQSPLHFTPIRKSIKQFIGIGNATGLGMAPYLVNHPVLISQWIEMRERALAGVKSHGTVTPAIQQRLIVLINRCITNTEETLTDDAWQAANNQHVLKDLVCIRDYLSTEIPNWQHLLHWSEAHCSLHTQELLVSLLLELYPALVDSFENNMAINEQMVLNPMMTAQALKACIDVSYQWVLTTDFSTHQSRNIFWYRSEEKMEPRLGRAGKEPGEDKQMHLGIGYSVHCCYQKLVRYLEQYPDHTTGQFLMAFPTLRGIVRRIQTMSQRMYGDIQANLLDEQVCPMHLLRAKLAFFGVGKFDPRSRLWVRNTMFQGAPLLDDIGKPFQDDWFMPVAPRG